MAARNYLYNKGIYRSVGFDIPVIAIGNLSMGGTGKTPTIEMLISMLQDRYNIAVLSRGYGRVTKGFRWVEPDSAARNTGDEPLQIKLKYPGVKVAVHEKRVDGILELLANYPETNLILLDDAFQHRAVKPYIQLLLTTHKRPFYKDFVLPMGRLRESGKGYKRADAVIVTKCPELIDKPEIERKISAVPVFYTFEEAIYPEADKVYGFSAIADNSAFRKSLMEHYDLRGFKKFIDHYRFRKQDLEMLQEEAKGAQLICTEKDWVKVKDWCQDLLYVKIRHIERNENSFKDWLISKLEHFEG